MAMHVSGRHAMVIRLRAWFAAAALVVVTAWPTAACAADAFNMEVTAAGIQLGPQVSGPPVKPEALAHRVVLLEFWGVNCPPCIASMPKLEELYRQLSPAGLVVIGAHAQGGPADVVRRTAAELGVTFPIVEQAQVTGGGDFSGIPHCMLFDHTGKCVFRGSPFEVHEAVATAVAAAPASLLEGRKLVKLAAFDGQLRSEQGFGGLLRKAEGLAASKDEATADEARFVVEKLTARGRAMLAEGESLKDANPVGAADLVQRCAAAFRGTDIGTAAAATLRDWKKDQAFQASMKAAQQLARLQAMRAGLLQALEVRSNDDVTPDLLARVPPAAKRQLADAVRGVQRLSPDSPVAAKAAAIATEFGLDLSR
jgi:thiol-disulfide isomerase/thioredoxin